jgi:hypothetical protein
MRFRIITLVYSLCALAAVTIPVRLSAQTKQDDSVSYSHDAELIEFDAPGAGTVASPACGSACGTIALANNDLGVVVGYYTDAHVVPHGFLRAPNGDVVSFEAPGAGLGHGLDQGTVAYSINDLGVIAGQLQDSSYVYRGFVRYPDGSFATFEAPGAGTSSSRACAPFCGTYALDINLGGATAGYYVDGEGVYHGFVRSSLGEITSFDPTGSVVTFVCEETCLNLEGATTGYYSDASGAIHGFVREPGGNITTVDAPGAVGFTGGASINPEGTITGYFLDSSGTAHGFVRTRGGDFTTFDVPSDTGAVETAAFSINLFGAVTGEFLDTSNVMHGFSRSACGTFATFDAPGAGTAAGQGTRPSTNNLEGTVTGWWIDGNSLNHGFVWIPGDGLSR